MQLEELIFSYLLSQKSLTALVQKRIYPVIMPQGSKLPAITYQRVSTLRKNVLQAESNFASIVIQFNCWANKYSEAKLLAVSLRQSLRDVSKVNGVENINAVFPAGEIDRFEPDNSVYCVDIDMEFHYSEN